MLLFSRRSQLALRRRPAAVREASHERVVVSDLLEPFELAALERRLGADEDRVRDRVLELLREHGLDATGIDVVVAGGRVSLRGAVADRLTSLLVEDLAWLVPQVQQCHNGLQVLPEGHYSGPMML